MKFLILGSAGQLGRALGLVLKEKAVGYDFPAVDITQPDSVRAAFQKSKPDIVINAAAYTAVDKAEVEHTQAFKVNGEGPGIIAQVSADLRIPVVHISTDYVFDGVKGSPYVESDPTHPLSVYGKSKWEGEEAVRRGNSKHFIIRTAWLYSLWGKNFVKTMLSLSENAEVKVVSDQFGSPTYVMHLAAGILKVIEYGVGTYHLAGSGGASWCDLTKEVYAAMGIKTPVRPVSSSEFPKPAPRPKNAVLATEHIRSLQLPPWKNGVQDFVRDYKKGIA